MHIGFAAQDPRSHYWMMVEYAMRERAAELGVTLTTLYSGPGNPRKQIAAIHALIDQGVAALLIGPTAANGLGAAVARAHAAHIPVIAVASPLIDCTVTSTVQSDNRKGAELAAAFLVDQLGGAGEVALLIGPTWLQDNVERASAVRRIFAQHPRIELAYVDESPDWSTAAGAAFAQAAIEHRPQLRAIAAPNDTLALGVVEGIARAGRTGQVVVTGFDAEPSALKAIHEGQLSATVHQSLRQLGHSAVEISWRAACGETVPPVVLIDVRLVTSTTLLDAALEAVYIMPNVLVDTVERGDALARAHDEVIRTRDVVIRAQELALRELSSPLIPISDTVMIMPLIGSIDGRRMQQIMDTLLNGIAAKNARTVILDITGVLLVDTQVAAGLLDAAKAVKLLGAQMVISGIGPEIAQALVGLGADLSAITTHATLQRAIASVTRRQAAGR